MQEHFNFWLEELAQHKGKEFDDPWYREVLSMHVHHFLRLIQELESNVKLEARRLHHKPPHTDNELRRVINLCQEHKLHLRQDGRDLGFHAPDHYNMGVELLAKDGKIKEYCAGGWQEFADMMAEEPMPDIYEDIEMFLEQEPAFTYEDGMVLL